MLSEICLYLQNWFKDDQPKYEGTFTISEGVLDIADKIQTNQYYLITGSVFNNGVHKRGSEELDDEVFKGTIQLMAVPKDVIAIAAEIKDWQTKYGGVSSANLSPFNSESFAGVYNYSKGSGSSSSASSVPGWQDIFGERLARYRKLRGTQSYESN